MVRTLLRFFGMDADDRVCAAGAGLLRDVVCAYKTAHDGASMPPEAYQHEVQRINGMFRPAPDGPKKTMLDVGSCYNPFGRRADISAWMDVTAVDLHPAPSCPDVRPCDWLQVQVVPPDSLQRGAAANSDPTPSDDGCLTRVVGSSYDAIVMSYLLSYIPVPSLRLRAVRAAVDALRPLGVLVLIDARRGGHRASGWPNRFAAAIQALGLRLRRTDHMQKSVGLVFQKPPTDEFRQEGSGALASDELSQMMWYDAEGPPADATT